MDLKHFHIFDQQDLDLNLNPREGETKLGETILYGQELEKSNAKFVVLGVEESIGVKGNLGIGGCETAWKSFLKSFLNIQHTERLDGSSVHLLGHFNFQYLGKDAESPEDFRSIVPAIDKIISPLIQQISELGKIPIIIGGSHANAYPIIKGVSQAKDKAISVINLDAHADFRPLEGRHSGNPFSTAHSEGYLSEYSILGLHENYNSQNMLHEMAKHKGISYYFWEDIFLRKKISFEEALNDFIGINQRNTTGIELDLDSLEDVLSSAMTPSGLTTTEARYYSYQTAHHLNTCYLHLCEGATALENNLENPSTGKLISYLVTDFVKGVIER